ncbi:MAG: endolytic transglycosylase MltG [Deltaproteobacteria bacterium]|jgi:UPF0755 protein|nr:endolytic transglycosylase MltG [Deltaproteobacteria bacterium]
MQQQPLGKSQEPGRRIRAAATWARALGQVFERVALFEIRGTDARVAYVKGIDLQARGESLSLLDQTPLRWTIEAASPVVSAGRSPGGHEIAETLGIDLPRAFAILPLVIDNRLEALAYADNQGSPLPLTAVSKVFEICENALRNPQGKPTVKQTRKVQRKRPRTTISRKELLERARKPQIAEDAEPLDVQEVVEPIEALAPVESVAPVVATPEPEPEVLASAEPTQLFELPVIADLGTPEPETSKQEEVHDDGEAVVTPEGVISLEDFREDAKPRKFRVAMAACLAFCVGGLGLLWAAPPRQARTHNAVLEISPGTSVAEIARKLQADGVIRSSFAFRVLAKIKGVERSMRAGHYRIASGLWAWNVVDELHDGQISTETITVPEGLNLKQVAELVESSGLVTREGFMEAARNPQLLSKYEIPGATVEGFLFPETYTFAKGLAPRDIVSAMVQLFFDRLDGLADRLDMAPEELKRRVVLASIVEREAKRSDEMPRIAGVFFNRLEKNMRLESCATVQYILGKPKERLRLSDLRQPSDYNTYLHTGLPPGPIANPGLSALEAAFKPESHEYLFFFARKDGSESHVFTQTYAQHQKALTRQRQNGKI